MKIIYFVVLVTTIIAAQQLDPYKFFPVDVGNIWEYQTPRGMLLRKISDNVLLSDSSRLIYYSDFQGPVYRIDKNSWCFYFPSSLNWRYYKLDADTGEHWMVRPETPNVTRLEAKVRVKYSKTILGRETTIMGITYYDLRRGDTVINEDAWPRFSITLGYGIGEYLYWDEEGGGPQRVLQGCVINGDTIGWLTSIYNEVFRPLRTELHQNYPNPFNSQTTIRYEIGEPGIVRIIVYAALGEEIQTLVNTYQTAGKYSVAFNAASLPGGIYFYSLMTGKKKTIRKMVYLK